MLVEKQMTERRQEHCPFYNLLISNQTINPNGGSVSRRAYLSEFSLAERAIVAE